eukprot:GEMP01003286.1.p1 GENE.GEMP01003286.1~~GEMP01003286.1.p1  ORF type:complete len:1499 (+),score=319.19 GEMP01003286.1:58-4497(+)
MLCDADTVAELLWGNGGPTACTSYVIYPTIITLASLAILLVSTKNTMRATNRVFKLILPLFILLPIVHAIVEGVQKHDWVKYGVDAVLVALFSWIVFIGTIHAGFFRWHTLCLLFAFSRINLLWDDFQTTSSEKKHTRDALSEGFHWTELFLGLILAIVFPGSRRGREAIRQENRDRLDTELLASEAGDVPVELNPEENATFLQMLIFGWLTPVIRTAYNKGLQGESLLRSDLPPMAKQDESMESFIKLEKTWNYECATGRRSLARAMVKAFWKEVLLSGCVKIVNDLQHFVNPILLYMLMDFLEPKKGEKKDKVLWHGWMLAIGMCVNSMLQSVVMAHYFQKGYRAGMHIRSAAILLVCKKTLRISPDSMAPSESAEHELTPSRQRCRCLPQRCCGCFGQRSPPQPYTGGTGEIVNLITADTDRFAWLAPYINLIWSAPLQLFLCFGFLYYYVGWSFLGSLVVMMFSAGCTWYVQIKSVVLQKQVMKVKDERLKVQNELINAVKMVKVYGWEDTMQERIREIRDRELKLQLKFKLFGGIQWLQFAVAPIFVSAACFFVLTVIMGEELTAAKVYPAMSLFGILTFPLAALPMMLNFLAQAQVSIKRIQHFLAKNEVNGLPPITNDGDPAMLELKFDHLYWPDDSLLLQGPTSITVGRGEFVVVAGATGSGKTGLLNSFTGEMACPLNLKVRGQIRIVTQTAWVRSATVKENIIGDELFSPQEYQQTLECCGLTQDLESLPEGDATIVGNRGVMLSGGQRVRVALARAVYNLDADVFIFDDILSAVDAHVAKLILRECLQGRLAGKTIILATHNMAAIRASNRIIHVDNRKVAYDGPTQSWTGLKGLSESRRSIGGSPTMKREDEAEEPSSGVSEDKISDEKPSDKSMVVSKEEESSRGSISWGVYKKLFAAMGGVPALTVYFTILVTTEFGKTSSDLWLRQWVSNCGTYSNAAGIGGYVGFAIMIAFLTFLMIGTRIIIGQKAARKIHLDCQYAILRATMAFVDVTPSGRIINRLSEDTVTLDSNLPVTLSLNCQWFLRLIIIFIMCSFASPWILVAFVPIWYIFSNSQQFYVPSARDLRRLDSTAKGPIFSHIGEMMHGLATIRVHRIEEPMHAINVINLDTQNQAYFLNNTSNRWLSVRMQLAGALLVSCSAFAIVALRGVILPATAGLVLTYALRLTDTLSALNRESADRETQMVSAERMMEYGDDEKVPKEAPLRIPDTQPKTDWPQGDLEWKNVHVKYRADLPLVLRDVSFCVKRGTSLGVCGRTGAGKSSVLNALMRMVEVHEGQQILDGIDLKTLGLHDLRSRMLVIPQDPVVFSGDVRFNLDPFRESSDEALWDALKRSELLEKVESLGGLDGSVGEGGNNFSHGERQLLAFARALVRKTQFGLLLLDEATSSVDAKLDAHIQKIVHEDFYSQGLSVISIAHRLQTIINYDNIAVFDDGELREYGPAKKLYADGGLFTALADEAGLAPQLT